MRKIPVEILAQSCGMSPVDHFQMKRATHDHSQDNWRQKRLLCLSAPQLLTMPDARSAAAG